MMQMDSFNFGLKLRVLEFNYIPNQSKDSFILIKFNTLSSCPEIVSVHWKLRCNSLNWTYHYDADVFLQFRVKITGSRAHFGPESVKRFIYFNKIQHFVLVSGDC